MTEELDQVVPEQAAQPQETADPPESAPETEITDKPAADAGEFDLVKVQKRYDKLTWEKGELSRRAEYAERRAEELERRLFDRQEPKEHEAPKSPPTLESVGYDEAKYTAAVLEYTRTEAARAADERIEAYRARDQQEGRVKSFRTREAEFAEKNPEYREKVYGSEFMSVPLSGEAAALIAESPDGPRIALHLAENLPLARELAQLPPMAFARELGRIEARLQPVSTPKISSAPPPPPRTDSTEDVLEKDPDKMTDAEWYKWREKGLRKRK